MAVLYTVIRLILFNLGPHNWKCTKLKNITLVKSGCLPPDIADICTTFPCLRTLSVSSTADPESLVEKPRRRELSINESYLSSGLAKLKDLRELELDLHYPGDISPLLGPSGIIHLHTLRNLEKLRIPMHYLVEKRSQNYFVIPHPTDVLPYSLRELTLTADAECVSWWLGYVASNQSDSAHYCTRTAVIQFLEGVLDLSGQLCGFPNLEKVVYSYGVFGGADIKKCGCLLWRRSLCKLHHLLNAKEVWNDLDGCLDRFDALVTGFRKKGISFSVLREVSEHGP